MGTQHLMVWVDVFPFPKGPFSGSISPLVFGTRSQAKRRAEAETAAGDEVRLKARKKWVGVGMFDIWIPSLKLTARP